MIDTIFFDYGGVVAKHYSEPFMTNLAVLLGVDVYTAKTLVSERSPHGRDYRLNIIDQETFWNMIRKKVPNKHFNATLAQELWAQTYVLDSNILHLLQLLKIKGLQLGILTNQDEGRYKYVQRNTNIGEYINFFLSSYKIRAMKPDFKAFAYLLQICNRKSEPERVLYIDDREKHIVAAVECGLQGYKYTNYSLLSEHLSHLNLL